MAMLSLPASGNGAFTPLAVFSVSLSLSVLKANGGVFSAVCNFVHAC